MIEYDPATPNPGGPESEWDCETLDEENKSSAGQILKLVDLENLPDGLLDKLESGKDILTIQDAVITGTNIRIPPGKSVVVTKRPDKQDNGGRRLAETVDVTKTVLVVKVNAADGSSTDEPADLSNFVFGTEGVNLKTQFDACSFGKLTFDPALDRSSVVGPNILNGATEVNVNVPIADGHEFMRNNVTAQLKLQFGVSDQRLLADHLMYCLPPGTMTSIAYAYVDSVSLILLFLFCDVFALCLASLIILRPLHSS